MQKIKNCLFAEDVLYDTEGGVWARFEDGLAILGVDTVVAWLGGPITSVSFKDVGTPVRPGMSVGSIEGPLHFDTVRSPLTGRVAEVNSALKDEPRLLNRDPYVRGWFVKLEPTVEAERRSLLDLSAARPALEAKIDRLRVRCFAAFPDHEMVEIGSECSGTLAKLDELIQRSQVGTVVHVVSDDVTAEVEMIAWADRTGQELVETRKEDNLFHFIIRKTG